MTLARQFVGSAIPSRSGGTYRRHGRWCPNTAEKRDKAIKDREGVAAKLTAEQITEAERLAREWRPETTCPRYLSVRAIG